MQDRIWSLRGWTSETRPEALCSTLGLGLELAGFNVLGTLEHRFEPQGYTRVWLLGESHLALHTFPEYGRSYVELSSCNRHMYERFVSAVALPGWVLE